MTVIKLDDFFNMLHPNVWCGAVSVSPARTSLCGARIVSPATQWRDLTAMWCYAQSI